MPVIAVQAPPLPKALPVLLKASAPQPAESIEAKAEPASLLPAKPIGRDRREASREEVDTTVVIFLIKIASRLQGRILDLSLGGCRIRTEERFPVGIYTRVEIEFHHKGLPFRLAGVIQAMHDKHTIGIRFLDISSRKREHVEQLIEEIREMREMKQETKNKEQGIANSEKP